ALSANRDVHGIHIRQQQAFGITNLTVRHIRGAVQAEAIVGAREAFEEAIVDHAAGAAADFLRRLADEHERALPSTGSWRTVRKPRLFPGAVVEGAAMLGYPFLLPK